MNCFSNHHFAREDKKELQESLTQPIYKTEMCIFYIAVGINGCVIFSSLLTDFLHTPLSLFYQ